MENRKAKVLWDFTIQTHQIIQTRRPNTIVKDKYMAHTWIIDMAVPGDDDVIVELKRGIVRGKWRSIKIWQEKYKE